MRRTVLSTLALTLLVSGANATAASAQVMPKAQVANLIVKVENGVDEFRKYLDRRAENASEGPMPWLCPMRLSRSLRGDPDTCGTRPRRFQL